MIDLLFSCNSQRNYMKQALFLWKLTVVKMIGWVAKFWVARQSDGLDGTKDKSNNFFACIVLDLQDDFFCFNFFSVAIRYRITIFLATNICLKWMGPYILFWCLLCNVRKNVEMMIRLQLGIVFNLKMTVVSLLNQNRTKWWRRSSSKAALFLAVDICINFYTANSLIQFFCVNRSKACWKWQVSYSRHRHKNLSLFPKPGFVYENRFSWPKAAMPKWSRLCCCCCHSDSTFFFKSCSSRRTNRCKKMRNAQPQVSLAS